MNFKKAVALLAMTAVSVMAQNKAYSGAELYSLDEWMYGKYEARMMMGATSGTVSSMFLYANGSEIADGRPWVEVDIEILGKNPGSFQSNIISGKAGNQNQSPKFHEVSPASNTGFHTYGLEWTPDYVRWTLDGQEVRKETKGSSIVNGQDQVSALTKPQGIRFNLWAHEDAGWVGPWDDNKLPVFQFINWVKRYKYTPGQGPNGSNFTLDWTDNFDTFDGSRWGKGDWTFDGNRVDLTDKNIYSREGMLILALTKKGQEMFNGQIPVDNEPAPQSSSSQQQNPWQPQSSSSQQVIQTSSSSVNPWEQQVSSSSQAVDPIIGGPTTVDPIVGPSIIDPNNPQAIMELRGKQLQQKSRSTFNAKGERVNKANASRYRVDFKL